MADHDAMLARMDTLCRLVDVLNYPESLTHEIRTGWLEIKRSLAQTCDYLKHDLPAHHREEEERLFGILQPKLPKTEARWVTELTQEHSGIERLAISLVRVIEPWLQLKWPPPRSESARFSGLATELVHHLRRHIRIENQRIFPMVHQVLTPEERSRLTVTTDPLFNRQAG